MRNNCRTNENGRVTALGITVRPATKRDGGAIGAVHAASFAAGYGHIFDATFLERAERGRAREWPRVIGGLLAPPRTILVALVDDRITAFSNAGPADDGRRVSEIYAFFAHPDVWGTPTATTLMRETCAALASEWNTVTLWTLEGAHRAHRFYERSGFRPTGAERVEPLSDWMTTAIVECRTIEYARSL
jgi:GNAT superfamily N-acetyltransferase